MRVRSSSSAARPVTTSAEAATTQGVLHFARPAAAPAGVPAAPAPILALGSAPLAGPVTEPVTDPVTELRVMADATSRDLSIDLSDDGVLVFDVETTGTDKKRDQVIELCVQFGIGRAGAPARSRTWRFLPQVPISPGAQAVHGISMDDLAACPPFAACADEIAAMFAEAKVLIGYNLMFDMDMIQAEYERLRRPPVDFGGKTIVDPFRLWQQCEPRSLQHAHQRFVGATFEAAHSAEADVAATARVLAGMLTSFGLRDRDWNGIADACDPTRASWIGPSRHVQWVEAGTEFPVATVVLRFGKHAGRALHQLAREDGGYFRWLLDKDFPSHVVELARAALDHRDTEAFHAWVRTRFGQAGGATATGGAGAPSTDAPVVSAERNAARGGAALPDGE